MEEGRPRELQSGQPHLKLWEDDGGNPPRKYFLTHEGQESDWERSTWVYKEEIRLNQPDIDFSREVTSLINDGRAVDIVYLRFIKAFDTVSHYIPF